MKLQYKKHRFRLISPIVGNKIYVTSSLKHGAKKCSTELNKNKYTEFSIIDIDTFHTYKFVINKKKHNAIIILIPQIPQMLKIK